MYQVPGTSTASTQRTNYLFFIASQIDLQLIYKRRRTKTNYCWSTTMSNQNDLKEFKQMITTRPSTTAAKEFFSDGGTKNWSSLPQRCERLQNVLETWVSFVFLRWFLAATSNVLLPRQF